MQTINNIEKPDSIPLRRYFVFVCTIVVGVVLSFFLYTMVNNWEKAHQRIEFESIVKGYANAVQSSLKGNVEALLFLGDFFNNSKHVTRQEFSSFVKSVLPRFPGVQAFSWNPLVMDYERKDYISQAIEDGYESFKFTERSAEKKLVNAARRQEYVIVYYIEPLEMNRPALGFDIASNPTRLKAITKGFDTAELAATERITLVQESGNQYGILMLLPIYRQGDSLNTREERYKNRKGFVVEVLRIGDVIDAALKDFSDVGIDITLYDLSADAEKQVLYNRPSSLAGMTDHSIEEEAIYKGLSWEDTFEVGGRQWEIVFLPSLHYHHSRQLHQAGIVLSGSLMLTFMLAFYLLKRVRYIAEIERKVKQEVRANQQLAREIAERKRAEEKATRFGHILERTLNEIYVFHADTLKFIQVNKGARKNLGYALEELQNLTPLDLKPEFTLDSYLKLINPLRKGVKSVIIFNTVQQRKDGSMYPVEVHLQYVAAESMPVFVAIIIDTTEKHRMEDQLRQAQKMEAIGTLAGGIAHDFNNILSDIIGYTELALFDDEGGSSIHHNLQEIMRAGERARDLVKQILAFSRQVRQERKPIQLKPIAKECLKFLRASLPATIEIHQDIQSDALVMADPTQIHQIIMNLCTNAEHAMRDQGGVLSVKLADVQLRTDFTAEHPELKPGPYLELTVSDTGYGIPAHNLDRIFDPFFTTKATGVGTGMGLSVVHGIVSSYEGVITASSEKGKGSTFSVYLPIIERQLEEQTAAQEPLPTGTEHILFVDDEPALENIGKQILKSLGYQVTTRTSSIEALELFKARSEQFDLVITDMSMPNMSGDILSAELMKVRPDIPIILCTGYSTNISDESAKGIGIKAFVYKPIVRSDLAKSIRSVLDGAKASSGTAGQKVAKE